MVYTILYLFSFKIGSVRYYNLFTHSAVDGHLGSFQFGSIMNKAIVNISV